MMQRKRWSVLPGLWLAIGGACYGEEPAGGGLEDLMDFQVSIASKKEESIFAAPNVVAVITAEDIRRSGATTLLEVLDRQAGIQTYGSSFIPRNVASIRGQALQHENAHVLALIDGRPLRDSGTGASIRPFFVALPLDTVERIEIIRGPGSVLYGSNAYSGVINVVTKSAGESATTGLGATYGSFDTRAIQAGGAHAGENWGITAAARSLRGGGWDYRVTDRLGTTDSFHPDNDDLGLTTTARLGDLSFTGFYGTSEENGVQPTGLLPHIRVEYRNGLADLGYQRELPGSWLFKYNLTRNYMHLEVPVGPVMSVFNSHDWLNEMSLSGTLGPGIGLLLGATHESLESGVGGAHYSTSRASAYAQADYSPVQWLKLVAGLQLNDPEGHDSAISPRASAVLSFDEHWGAKLMYGEAFRSPSFVETRIFAPANIVGNPDLEPETVATTEAQVFYRTSAWNLALTGYHSHMSELIERVGFPIQFVNSGHIDFDGVELEGMALLPRGLRLSGSVSWQRNEDELGRRDTTYTPTTMAKVGLSWVSPQGHTFDLHDSYFGEPAQIREFQPIVELNPPAEAYHLLSFNASFDLSRLTQGERRPRATLSLLLDNLLDEDIRFPDINAGTINSIPIHSGRAAYATVRLSWEPR